MSGGLLQGVPLWAVAAALPIVLVVAWLLGSVARWLLRGRARLGVATTIVVSIIGTALGLLLAWWIDPRAALWSPLAILLALGMTVVAVAGYGAVAAHFQRPQRAGIANFWSRGSRIASSSSRPLGSTCARGRRTNGWSRSSPRRPAPS